MRINLLLFFLAIWIFALLPSCKETPDDFQVNYGFDYFPLSVGKFITYQVDSTIFDPTADTPVYYSQRLVKEEITDTLHDLSGNVLYKIERYERVADTLPWQVMKVFTASLQDNQAVVTEDNLRFIRLTFPVEKNERWDGNAHFDPTLIVTVAGESIEMFKGWQYKTLSVGEPDSVGVMTFPEVAAVQESDNENLIELRRSFAKYAKGIGLIYRELWILDTQCIEQCAGKTWEEKAEKGFILRQTIIEHN